MCATSYERDARKQIYDSQRERETEGKRPEKMLLR